MHFRFLVFNWQFHSLHKFVYLVDTVMIMKQLWLWFYKRYKHFKENMSLANSKLFVELNRKNQNNLGLQFYSFNYSHPAQTIIKFPYYKRGRFQSSADTGREFHPLHLVWWARLQLYHCHMMTCHFLHVYSERNYRSPTRQKREENKFGENVCVRTRQSGDRTSWGEFWLFCTRPCQPAWRSSFSVNDSVKFLIQQ